MASQLINFCAGLNTTNEGLLLSDIIAANDLFWENDHTFIQWVFPTKNRSVYNPKAPLLTSEDIEFIKPLTYSHYIKSNFNDSFERFLRFLGLCIKNNKIQFHIDEEYYETIWGVPNHNWLRITRCLECLNLVGLHSQLKMLIEFLEKEHEKLPFPFETIQRWEIAATLK